jgi:hypothetical protein
MVGSIRRSLGRLEAEFALASTVKMLMRRSIVRYGGDTADGNNPPKTSGRANPDAERLVFSASKASAFEASKWTNSMVPRWPRRYNPVGLIQKN